MLTLPYSMNQNQVRDILQYKMVNRERFRFFDEEETSNVHLSFLYSSAPPR